jgi:hypothetical protein
LGGGGFCLGKAVLLGMASLGTGDKAVSLITYMPSKKSYWR